MKKYIKLISLSFLSLVMLAFGKSQKKKRVVFFGDSITQAGARPGGYIVKLDSLLQQKGITNYDLVGAGVSGNKVYDLYLRLETDVLEKQPDIVVIYVGINDVWHKATSGTGTDADKFEKFYKAIIKKLTDKNIKVIVCTPTTIGERYDNSNQQDGDLNRYSFLIKNIAKEASLPVCDLREIFLGYLKKYNTNNAEKGILTTDRVHLSSAGNLLVAQSICDVLQQLQ